MLTEYTDAQLDALREVSNIGSGKAATSLSAMLDRSVDVSVPAVYAVPLSHAVETVGPPERETSAVLVPVTGELDTIVLLLFGADDAATVCTLLGVEPGTELADSALAEVGNILSASYLGAISSMTGLALEPKPPQTCVDMLGAVVGSVLALGAAEGDVALLLDSKLIVEDANAHFAFLFLLGPDTGGVQILFERLGLAA